MTWLAQNAQTHNDIQGTATLRGRRAVLILDFLLPTLILLAGTVLIRIYGLDLAWSGNFYTASGTWQGLKVPFFDLAYKYGTLPSLFIAIIAFAALLASVFFRDLKVWRRTTLYLVLAMALGPGLVVNAILKDHWGRPRPRNVTEFRGRYAFEDPLEYDPVSPGESFPSGHASMGFYIFALYFIARGRNRKASAAFFLLALCYGAALGYIRVAQGGHFVSDVLWSGELVYLVCASLYYLLRLDAFPAGTFKRINTKEAS